MTIFIYAKYISSSILLSFTSIEYFRKILLNNFDF